MGEGGAVEKDQSLSATFTTMATMGDVERRTRILASEEGRGQRFDEHEGRQADCEGCQGPCRAPGILRAPTGRARNFTPRMMGSASSQSAIAAGRLNSRPNSMAQFWLAMADCGFAGDQLSGQQGQQRRADGDADHT